MGKWARALNIKDSEALVAMKAEKTDFAILTKSFSLPI